MINEGDYVVYGGDGICVLEGFTHMTIDQSNEKRTYCVLRPLANANAKTYVPTDNTKLMSRIRPVISPSKIDSVIEAALNNEMNWVDDQKERSNWLHRILERRDEHELLSLIACLKKKSQQCHGKISPEVKLAMKKAEEIIDCEFSFSLGIDKQAVRRYIKEKVDARDREIDSKYI